MSIAWFTGLFYFFDRSREDLIVPRRVNDSKLDDPRLPTNNHAVARKNPTKRSPGDAPVCKEEAP